jgi:hypothetical protein
MMDTYRTSYRQLCAARHLGILVAFLLVGVSAFANQTAAADPLTLITDASEAGLNARQKAVGMLGKNLDADSVAVLYAFMDAKQNSGLSREELLALKDSVCTKLDHQAAYPKDLPDRLMAMYADKTHDEGWRDYCIQHLNVGFRKASADQRASAVKVFWTATGEQGGSIPGTALIALKDNMADPDIDRDAVAAKALEIVLSKTSGEAAKTTALQICAQLGEKKCLPVARELAASTKARTLKLSAIASIGSLGNQEDKALLEKCASSSDRLTQVAAKSALEKLATVAKETKPL